MNRIPRRRYMSPGEGDGLSTTRTDRGSMDFLPPDPIKKMEAVDAATPLRAKIRWFALGILFFAYVAIAIVFCVLMVRDYRRQNNLDAELADTDVTFRFLEGLVANISAVPNCTLAPNITFSSNFSDALFAIFPAADPTAEIQFNLSGLDPGSLVTWTIQNASGVVAYLDDIPPISSVFQDDEFVVQNAAVTTKQVMLSVAAVGSGVTVLMTVQDASGTIAYLSDITAQPTVFFDDVFAVQNDPDTTKEVMLDISQVGAGQTTVMTVQNASGTILYLENITGPSLPFTDTEFIVFQDGDPTAQVRLDLSIVSTATNITMAVQDADGTIAYLSDIPQIVEVLVNVTRLFPDPGFEGVSNISQLGNLGYIEISVCGGGGGGGAGSGGGGGGSGSGHENFRIYDPTTKFFRFNCEIGSGGAAGSGGMSGGNGNTTVLRGQSDTDFYLNLIGYGGGGGEPTTAGGAAGGAGGGGGGNANGVTPGDMGNEGGLTGGLGGLVTGSETFTDGQRGEINLTWRAGGGGSAATNGTPTTTSRAAAWNGGFATNSSVCDGSTGCGAASMFGPGGIGSFDPDGSLCAGGGSAGNGGSGACLFRYYLIP